MLKPWLDGNDANGSQVAAMSAAQSDEGACISHVTSAKARIAQALLHRIEEAQPEVLSAHGMLGNFVVVLIFLAKDRI